MLKQNFFRSEKSTRLNFPVSGLAIVKDFCKKPYFQQFLDNLLSFIIHFINQLIYKCKMFRFFVIFLTHHPHNNPNFLTSDPKQLDIIIQWASPRRWRRPTTVAPMRRPTGPPPSQRRQSPNWPCSAGGRARRRPKVRKLLKFKFTVKNLNLFMLV